MNANLKQCDLAGLAQPIRPVTCRRLQSLQAKVCLHAVAIDVYVLIPESALLLVENCEAELKLAEQYISLMLTDYTDIADRQMLFISQRHLLCDAKMTKSFFHTRDECSHVYAMWNRWDGRRVWEELTV